MTGFYPNYAPSIQTSWSQTQIGATVPSIDPLLCKFDKDFSRYLTEYT
jgi:hypothetical protein